MARILIFGVEAPIQNQIGTLLQSEGFEVESTDDDQIVSMLIEHSQVELIILDVTVAHVNGWRLARGLGQKDKLPMILLGHGGDHTSVVRGFQLGADDYLAKPFHPEELVVRVRALLKRHRTLIISKIEIGELLIDKKAHEVRVRGQRLLLPLKEFQLLFTLASYPNHILTRSQLIEQVWGDHYEGSERTVDVHIKRLRERLGAITSSIRFLSVRGLGYRFEIAVEG